MNVKTLSAETPVLFGIYALVGSAFLALTAQCSIHLPFTPVPVTLQTFGVFMLILMQGRNLAFASICAYLMEASCGLPVLSGGMSNPLWMLGPKAGYLIGFLACAYISGSMLRYNHKPTFFKVLLSLVAGQAAIYTLGTLWLSLFVGSLTKAIALGVIPFLSGAFLKVMAASCASQSIKRY